MVVIATAGAVGGSGIERRGSALSRLWHRIDAFPLWGSQSLPAIVDGGTIPAQVSVSHPY